MSRISTIALLAILGTILVFLFPAACGPFTATNGPATALRAAAALQALLILLCSSRLLALIQLPAFSLTVEVGDLPRGVRDLSPFCLRC